MASVQEGQHFWCTPTLSAVRGGIKGLMSFQIMAKNDGEFTTSTCVQIVYEWGMEGARLIARGRTRTRKAPRTNTDAYTKTHTHTQATHAPWRSTRDSTPSSRTASALFVQKHFAATCVNEFPIRERHQVGDLEPLVGAVGACICRERLFICEYMSLTAEPRTIEIV